MFALGGAGWSLCGSREGPRGSVGDISGYMLFTEVSFVD
jgi:hypothetical protein